MKALVVSNCATGTYVEGLKTLFPEWDVRGAHLGLAQEWLGSKPAFVEFYDGADVLLTMDPTLRPAGAGTLAIEIPPFYFRGLHPDSFHLVNGPGSVLCGGNLYSRIATVAFMLGRSEDQTLRLFTPKVYDAIGYFAAYDSERRHVIDGFAAVGIDIAGPFDDWRAHGRFLYTYNHPKVFVLTDILRRALAGRLLTTQEAEAAAERLRGVRDELSQSIAWPVYPEIGRRQGVAAEPFVWRRSAEAGHEIVPLETFVANTFEHLRRHASLSPDLVPGYAAAVQAIG